VAQRQRCRREDRGLRVRITLTRKDVEDDCEKPFSKVNDLVAVFFENIGAGIRNAMIQKH
jgi:hypothetical protein